MLYKTLLQAAIAALHLAAGNTNQTGTEWAGAILETPAGQFVVTAPVAGSEDHFDLKVEIPVGDKLVGLYHTHPSNDSTTGDNQFSPLDVQVATQLRVPSFIWVQRTKAVKEFTPGRSFVSDCGGGLGSGDDGCSAGQMVGQV